MEISNIETNNFFKELLKIDVSFKYFSEEDERDKDKEEIPHPVIILYNGFEYPTTYDLVLIDLLNRTKTEIFDNLLVITDNIGRENYLKRLWFQVRQLDADFETVLNDFQPEGILYKDLNLLVKGEGFFYEGYIVENRKVNIELPDHDFNDTNRIANPEEPLLRECFFLQYFKLHFLIEFVFDLCQTQNIKLDQKKEQILDFLKREDKFKELTSGTIETAEIIPTVEIEAITPTIVNSPIKKIKWEGKLKEFAELIDQLHKRNYINIPDGELKPMVETLCTCFDFSGTQKSDKSDTVMSLCQYLKPSEVENKIYTKRYQPKFESILPEK